MVLGVIGAIRPRGIVDRGITALSSVMLAVPSFWLALVLILIFAVENPIFPTIGYAPLARGRAVRVAAAPHPAGDRPLA